MARFTARKTRKIMTFVTFATRLNKATNATNVRKLNVPSRLRITVKNRVDSPIMTVRGPTMENQSFHKLMSLTVFWQRVTRF
jgi:hypothetical protein